MITQKYDDLDNENILLAICLKLKQLINTTGT
jgi:hypothetical protein